MNPKHTELTPEEIMESARAKTSDSRILELFSKFIEFGKGLEKLAKDGNTPESRRETIQTSKLGAGIIETLHRFAKGIYTTIHKHITSTFPNISSNICPTPAPSSTQQQKAA